MKNNNLIMAASIAVLAMPVGVSFADAPIVQGHLPPSSAATTASAPLNASATTQTPDQALVTADSDTAAPANPLDMGNQIAMLQQQVQDLRGQLEVQGHTIAQLQSEISQLSGGKFPATINSPAPASAPAVAPQATSPAAPASAPVSSVASADPSFAAATPDNSAAAPAASAPAASVPAPTETQLYQKAYDLMVAKQYTEASVQLQTYLQSYPNGQYAADSHYSLGEMALISGNLAQAQAQFNVVINQFAQSPKVPDAMLKVGMIFSSQSKWKQASNEFNLVIREYPGTPSAQMAQQQLEEIQRSGN